MGEVGHQLEKGKHKNGAEDREKGGCYRNRLVPCWKPCPLAMGLPPWSLRISQIDQREP